MGLEQARRGIEDAVRIFLGSTLSATWRIEPGSLKNAENAMIWVGHENCKRSHEAVEALKKAIERAIQNTTGEVREVRVEHSMVRTWVEIRRKESTTRDRIEDVVKRFIEDCTAMEWSLNTADPKRITTLTIQHEYKRWKDGERKAFLGKLKAAIAHKPQLMIWGMDFGTTVTTVHIIKVEECYSIPPRSGKQSALARELERLRERRQMHHPELTPIPEANTPHIFFAKRLNTEEPCQLIRDELADWTREQHQKKTEGKQMFAVNEIVAVTEETKAIKLVVHKEETEKELPMTAQVAAQYQNTTVRKVDVADNVLVLHVGNVKD